MAVLINNWWNTAWTKRKKLRVSTTDAVGTDYAVQFRVTGSRAENIYNDSQTTGNDFRILYWTGFKWVELHRHLVTFSSSEIDVWFKLQAGITENSFDDNYFIYYGNASSFVANVTPSSVFATFTGKDEYIEIAYNAAHAPTSTITFECLAYRENWTNYTTNARLLSKTETGGYQIGINEDIIGAGFIGSLVRRNGAYGSVKFPLSNLTSGWHHFATTYDGRYIRFYVDGVLRDTNDAGATYAIQYAHNNSLLIGAEAGTGTTPVGGYFEGYIEEVRIWNIARTNQQIEANMYREVPSGSTGLVGYWKLNDGTGTTATDSTSTQNGTLTNGASWYTTTKVPNNLSRVYTFATDFDDNTFMRYDSSDAGWSTQTTTVKEGTHAAASTSASAQSIQKNNINLTTCSMEGWFRFGQTTQHHFPFFNTGNLASLYWIVAANNGNWQYNIGWGYTNFPNSAAYSANTWYYIRLVFDNANSKFRVWTGTDPNSLSERTTSAGLDAKDINGFINNLIKHLRHLNTSSGGSGTMWVDGVRIRPWTANEPTILAYDEPDKDVTAKGNIKNTLEYIVEAKGYINPPAELEAAIAATVRRVKGKAEFKWDGISWTDESQYLISARGNINLAGPLGESSAGEMDIELDSTSGRFDPANSSSPIQSYLKPKIEVRVSVDFEDSGFYTPIFFGMIRTVDPNKRTAITNIHCFDKTKKILDKKASTTVLVNKRLDEVFVALAEEAGLEPEEYNADISEHSVHGAWFGNRNIWEMMGQLAQAERGRIFFDEKGVLRFWGRPRLRKKKPLPITLSYNNWLRDIDYDISDSAIKNHVTVIARPRASAGIQQVWSNGDVEALDPFTDTLVFIPAKQSQFAFIELEDPAVDWIHPIAYSDYTANTENDGTGSDLTGSIRVTNFTPYDDAVFLIVSNDSDQGAYLTKFNIRANPIRVYKWIKVESIDNNSIDLYGEKTLELENDFIDDESNAQSIATEETLRWRNAKNNFKAQLVGIPYLRCGDVVTVEVDPGVEEEYLISGLDWELDEGGFTQSVEFINPIEYPIFKSVSARANILGPVKTVNAKGFINFVK